MSIQWTIVASFLYVEIGCVILLMVPFLKASTWKSIFRSRLGNFVKAYVNIYFSIFVVVLSLLFADGVRDVTKYSGLDDTSVRPETEIHRHMKLFRAQRNLYIAGFALFLIIVIRRIVSLLSQQASLEAQSAASLKQAQSASETASAFMETADKKEKISKDSVDISIIKELNELKKQLFEKDKELSKAKLDLDTIKRQSENTNKEYDRVLSELQSLENKVNESASKKDD